MARKFMSCFGCHLHYVCFCSVTGSMSDYSSDDSPPRRKKYSKKLPKAYQRHSKPRVSILGCLFWLLS